METLQPPAIRQETAKSFDVLSSIKLYRHDLETNGDIHPETRQRVYDEELSYIAEGLNRPNCNEFTLKNIDSQLVYFHQGAWKPYIGTLIKGLETAQSEAAQDPRKKFEVARRVEDLIRGYQLQDLAAGERTIWYYDFPAEQLASYGDEFLEGMGYQPNRQMGYLCDAEKTSSGELIIRHQSVDGSDPDAFSAAMLMAGQGGSLEDMRQAYDDVMEQKTGKEFYAGRIVDIRAPEANAWSLVMRHKDLIENYFLNQIEEITKQDMPEQDLIRAKKRLTYGVWAALKERLDNQLLVGETQQANGINDWSISYEVQSAYSALAARGETLFGCGGSIQGETALLSASTKDVFESIFGKKMTCPFCGDINQHGDPCSSSQRCTACTAEVKNGKVTSRGNGGRKNHKQNPGNVGLFDWISLELEQYEIERQQKAAKKITELASARN